MNEFGAAVKLWKLKRPFDLLTIDFNSVEKPYPNGMLGILSTISFLRNSGAKLKVILPNNSNVRRLFINNNWAHYLDNDFPVSENKHERHLVTRQFKEFTEIAPIINDFMDVVLRSIRLPKDIISALEWSVNEICDNVINHSDSITGGFVQVVTFPTNNSLAFTVSDSGKGILKSLKEGIPTLQTDSQAIGEAIKSGVTRNKEFGQGNGLAGTLRITTMTEGSLDITSGSARIISTSSSNKVFENEDLRAFDGTSISGQIITNKKFSISKALEFNGILYTPINIIDLEYEMKDQDCLLLEMKKETTGVGTRQSGKQMRNKINNLIQSKKGYPIYVDWNGIPVISSSFADEFMGKLFLEIGPLNFSATIRNKNMEPLIQQLLDKAISQRLTQT
ncbi:STAS-like domain-containing protein [Sediminibacterium sp.]|uniref:STAS-like domain-containing protein n=1 Tax=Sediminibacterium sp. TaxID=1917865 RepID=UPI0027367A9A|nr:DUF4325 domain-containing protein [Sediminibacterium sp.]